MLLPFDGLEVYVKNSEWKIWFTMGISFIDGSWRMNWFYWTWCWSYDTMFVTVEVVIKSIWCAINRHIVVGTDTWLKPNIHTNEVFPEKYNVYRKDRIDQEEGGFLLAIKKEFISDEVNDMHLDEKGECFLSYVAENFLQDQRVLYHSKKNGLFSSCLWMVLKLFIFITMK
jgi:hypothetical protein